MTSPLLGWTLLPAPWWRTSCATYTMTANRCVGLGGEGGGWWKIVIFDLNEEWMGSSRCVGGWLKVAT